jgi:hypothetical protein
MKRITFKYLLPVLFVVSLSVITFGQERITVGLGEWLNVRIKEVAREEIQARVTQRNFAKQSETPSISANTTSLVERSSASDLVGVALNLAGLNTNSSEMEATSMSATVSAYAFKAAGAKRDPLDPAFYNANRDWRRVSFTLGFDYPEDQVGNVNERAVIFGMKYLPYDKRDASDRSNRAEIAQISNLLGEATVQSARMFDAVFEYVRSVLASNNRANVTDRIQAANLYFGPGTWGTTYQTLLTDEERQRIDEIIKDHIAPFATLTEATISATDRIHKKPQIAFSYLTKQRKEDRPDEHSLGAIFDLGFAPRFTLTLNANFDYVDNKMMEDSKGGRIAAEFQAQLNRDKLEGRMPVFLTFSGDGCWMTNMTPTYRAQAKISIPIVEGIEIPLSVTYASRTDLIDEADVRGKFGFTFDIARIAQAFSGGLLGRRR